MRPPICAICHDRFPAAEGGTVRFADYQPLPDGMVGHPKGLEWFCGAHIEGARALSGEATRDALKRLKAS